MDERETLLNRIVKGAEFIESLPKGDARHKSAMIKYDNLCKDLETLDRRK